MKLNCCAQSLVAKILVLFNTPHMIFDVSKNVISNRTETLQTSFIALFVNLIKIRVTDIKTT